MSYLPEVLFGAVIWFYALIGGAVIAVLIVLYRIYRLDRQRSRLRRR